MINAYKIHYNADDGIVRNKERIQRISYPGGKGQAGTYQKIINQMPPHSVYIEPFLGGGAVMANKKPAALNIGIEIDPVVAAQWESSGPFKILNADAFEYLKSWKWERETLIYCDPPYLIPSRRQHRQIYRYEMTEADHDRLLRLIKSLSCMVMISGYWSDIYARELTGWRTISFQAVTQGGSVATEWVWMNFPEPAELHDYQYLGESFRERERIKRKINRWVNRLERMSILERRAISAALAKVGDVARLDLPSSEIAMAATIAENEDDRADRRHR